MKTDKEIIKAVLAGYKEQYREIVSRYQNKVYSVALKISHNPKDAEDIAQEIFIQAYKSLFSFHFESNFSTWLYRVAVNKSLDWKRKNQNKIMPLAVLDFQKDLDKNENSIPAPEEALLQKDKQESIQLLITQLPANYQSVIKLYYFENLSYQQIADSLGIAKKTVESRLYRAKNLLKKLWIKEGKHELQSNR